jgi:hypothetical protein
MTMIAELGLVIAVATVEQPKMVFIIPKCEACKVNTHDPECGIELDNPDTPDQTLPIRLCQACWKTFAAEIPEIVNFGV